MTNVLKNRSFSWNVVAIIISTLKYVGVENTIFFGYNINGKSFKMMDDRAAALKKIPFPSGAPAQNQTVMRSFLGKTRIF